MFRVQYDGYYALDFDGFVYQGMLDEGMEIYNAAELLYLRERQQHIYREWHNHTVDQTIWRALWSG